MWVIWGVLGNIRSISGLIASISGFRVFTLSHGTRAEQSDEPNSARGSGADLPLYIFRTPRKKVQIIKVVELGRFMGGCYYDIFRLNTL